MSRPRLSVLRFGVGGGGGLCNARFRLSLNPKSNFWEFNLGTLISARLGCY